MATWPQSLPYPQKNNFSLSLGNNSLNRVTQSGKIEHVRFGSGAPDKCNSVTLRLFTNHNLYGNQLVTFWSFYNVDLSLGTNWFDAPWISDILKYPDHKGKIVGYPEVVSMGHCKDVSFGVLIKKSSACPELDYTWPLSD